MEGYVKSVWSIRQIICADLLSPKASQSETNELVTYLVDFKKSLNDCGYSGPAVVFLFCRVGYDPAAEAFLGTLSSSEAIQDIICCYKEELGVKEQNQDKAFTGEVSIMINTTGR